VSEIRIFNRRVLLGLPLASCRFRYEAPPILPIIVLCLTMCSEICAHY